MGRSAELHVRGATVTLNVGHPEQYLWIAVAGRLYFLGVLIPNMRRRDVRVMAERWLDEHR